MVERYVLGSTVRMSAKRPLNFNLLILFVPTRGRNWQLRNWQGSEQRTE